jgi:hypothetical protein
MLTPSDEMPVALYKYLNPDRAATILKDLQIRFSQASILNDATELKPLYKGIATHSDLKRLMTDRLREKYPGTMERFEQSLRSDRAAQIIDDVMSRGVAQAEATLPQSTEKIYDLLDNNFGVLSLSEIPNDPLLWGYYGDGGYGFLIQFDPAHKWFWARQGPNDDFRHLRRVVYLSERPTKYLVDTSGADLLYSKGIEWEHEKEWRIIRNFNEAARKVGPDQYGKDVLLFAIPPECVQSVVIGCRAMPNSIARIQEIICRNPALAHVQFQDAIMKNGGITLVGRERRP